ncbi:MAG: hypothetical protein ACKOBW_16175 [Planctomycetota bacterium]
MSRDRDPRLEFTLVRNQEEHHRKMNFQDEYRAMLRRYGMEFDDQYVWD